MRLRSLRSLVGFTTVLSFSRVVDCLVIDRSHGLDSRLVCQLPATTASSATDPPYLIDQPGNEGFDEPDTSITLGKRSGVETRVPSDGSGPTHSWTASVAGGRDIWNRLQHVLNTPDSQTTPASCITINTRWKAIAHKQGSAWVSSTWNDLPPHYPAVDTAAAYSRGNRAWQSVELVNPVQRGPKYWYHNIYSTLHKSIIAGDLHGQQQIPNHVTGVPDRAPDRCKWFRPFLIYASLLTPLRSTRTPHQRLSDSGSTPGHPSTTTLTTTTTGSDVTWAYWNMLCAHSTTDPSSLTWILHQGITNHRTQSIMARLLANQPRVPLSASAGSALVRTLTPSDGDLFYALLRTSNVSTFAAP